MHTAVYILGIYSIAATIIIWAFWRINVMLEKDLTEVIKENLKLRNNSVE